ncbi:chemotaxis protein CheW [Jannaschia formosa]|uniref:chemotaxis protein CheW n=1 Tax=Jannaschia formosa TaxID=2259592 RepID=UPI000E1BDBBD|nr:chemotaxis protein CheW [Jannaschia formosa]TFL17927.1 chemotaxis protein CheW [Jannaschia formosa]
MNGGARIAGTPASRSSEMLLLFSLSGETFGITVSNVSEVLDPIPPTEIPNADPFAAAVVNVRGAIVPLIDIRRRLRIRVTTEDGDTRIVVLDLPIGGVPTKIAMIADAVTKVIETDLGALEPIPELGARWPKKFVEGVARHDGDLVVLLDPQTLFDPDEPTAPDMQETTT